MGNLKKAWTPNTVPEDKQELLAVMGDWPMNKNQHRLLMEDKVRMLFNQAGADQAQQAMEMSEEYFPELAIIARNQSRKYWPEALMQSDTMNAMLSLIKWDQESQITPDLQEEMLDALQDQSLQSLIESL